MELPPRFYPRLERESLSAEEMYLLIVHHAALHALLEEEQEAFPALYEANCLLLTQACDEAMLTFHLTPAEIEAAYTIGEVRGTPPTNGSEYEHLKAILEQAEVSLARHQASQIQTLQRHLLNSIGGKGQDELA